MQSAIFINGELHIVELGPLESERMIKERVAFHKQEKKGHFGKKELDNTIQKFSTMGTRPFYDVEEEDMEGTPEDVPTYSMPKRAADPVEIGGTMFFPPATCYEESDNLNGDHFTKENEYCDDMEAGPFHPEEYYSDSSEDDQGYYPHYPSGPQNLLGPSYGSQNEIQGTTYYSDYNKPHSRCHSSESDGYSTGSNYHSSSSSEDEEVPPSQFSMTPHVPTEMRRTTYFPLPPPKPPIPSLLNCVPPLHSRWNPSLPRPLLPPMDVYRPTPLMNSPTRRFY